MSMKKWDPFIVFKKSTKLSALFVLLTMLTYLVLPWAYQLSEDIRFQNFVNALFILFRGAAISCIALVFFRGLRIKKRENKGTVLLFGLWVSLCLTAIYWLFFMAWTQIFGPVAFDIILFFGEIMVSFGLSFVALFYGET